MISESEKIKLKKYLDSIKSIGYNKHTRGMYYYMAKVVSREMDGNIGKISCPTTRKFVLGWIEKYVK